MRVAVAGTFGPLHDGHRALFRTALERGGGGVVVGVTSDDLAQETRTKPRPVPPFEERRESVRSELDELDEWGRDIEVRRLTDRFGFAASEAAIDALVTSPETCGELAEINRRRATNGFDPIEGIVVPYVRAADGERISSTRLVHGKIDEHGDILEG
jgi:pantetheine-phosphate adenylyltransferase